MKKDARNRLVYSPTDLCRFMESPFATWMDRYHLERPGELTPDETSEELELVFEKGSAFEADYLRQLVDAGRDVFEVPERGDRLAATLAAMQEGREVLYQGNLRQEPFEGFPDFLVRVDSSSALGEFHYEVWDTKLARKPKPYFLVQLCCYAEMLESIQKRRCEMVRVVLGSGDVSSHRTDDAFYFYLALKEAFLRQMTDFDPARRPVPDPTADHGRWQSHADAWLEKTDHLVRVAGIAKSQVKKLERAGITTLSDLAATDAERVPGLNDAMFEKLRSQARLQVKSTGLERPLYEVLPPTEEPPGHGLSLLPPRSDLDVYFDIEGYPLTDGGLEYLLGATHLEEGERRFADWWAHDSAQEKRSFEGFIDWVHGRWRCDASMHVYHYAAYEVLAVKHLMGKYGTREDQVDELLRGQVFVDLYKVVRRALLVGEPSYSLKYIERLYRGKREGEVQTAMASVVSYARWIEEGESQDWRDSPILKEIRDYNRDDCDSTLELAEWLRERQRETGIAYGKEAENEEEAAAPVNPDALDRTRLAQELLRRAGDDAESLDALLGYLAEFHRREDKPTWWAMYERAEMSEKELIEDLNCLGGLRRTSDAPVPIKRSTGFWYSFPADQDTKLSEGSSVRFSHDCYLCPTIEELDFDSGRVCLKVGNARIDRVAPVTGLIPDEYVRPDPIPGAVADVARAWLNERRLAPALSDFLHREPPRFAGHAGGPLASPDQAPVEAALRLVPAMEETTLCIQGPPGSGKTTMAAQVVLQLLADGRKVGITSNSHSAILNLMEACAKRSDWRLSCLKVGGDSAADFFQRCNGARYLRSSGDAAAALASCDLIGGTAWLFSRADIRAQLDYLFVDEAGQVSLANLVGMSCAARNLVLIGDQMQLSQPTQGSHPGESGLSCLEYYMEGRATIPPERGLFLGLSYRMHPALCRFISGAVYENRLGSAPDRENRTVDYGPRAGIHFVPVHHEGNTQGSEEEVEEIASILDELLGRRWTGLDGEVAGRIGQDDVLVVAPYNMQVRALEKALPPGIAVGTVDRFQGRQALVVIISMCASDAIDSPRGLEFLFNRNRLNVAISRAQCLAIVVGSNVLASARCGSIRELELVNLFCRIVAEGVVHEDL